MRKKIRSEQSETLKKVLRYLKRYWFFLALSFGLAAITVASTLYIPLLTGDAVDCVIGKGQVDFTGVFAVLKRMVMVIGVTAVAQWGMNICNNKMTYQIVRDIRNEAFAKLEILPLKYLDGHPSGEVVSRIIADVDQFADGLLPAHHEDQSLMFVVFGSHLHVAQQYNLSLYQGEAYTNYAFALIRDSNHQLNSQ